MEKQPCPVSTAKLALGLNCCRPNSVMDCINCPYKNDKYTCTSDLAQDAFSYIIYLEDLLDAKEVTENEE